MVTHSSTLAWEIPWIEEPRGLQAMGLQRVGHSGSEKEKRGMSFSLFLPKNKEDKENTEQD